MLCGMVPAHSQEPLQVYILAGQSNMEGHAHVRVLNYMGEDPATAGLLAEIQDTDGTPRLIDDVWISYQTGIRGRIDGDNREVFGQLTSGYGSQVQRDYDQAGERIGPELAFGITMHNGLRQPILIIKTAWGGQSLHTDFRSPSSGPYEPSEDDITRGKFATAEQQQELAAKTGKRYRQMIEHVRFVLSDIRRVYPDYNQAAGFEIAGFVWFQGFNDMVGRNVYPSVKDEAETPRFGNYTKWLANFIHDVRHDLKVPELPFIIGLMGVDGISPNEGNQAFRNAQAAVAELPKLQGNVIAVATGPFWDESLAAIDAKRQQIRQKAHLLRSKNAKHENADGQLTAEQTKQILADFEANLFTEADYALEKRAKSNAGYHYLGSAKTYSLIGQAFAQALLQLPDANHLKHQEPAPEQQPIHEIKAIPNGLHGYIGYRATRPPDQSEFSAGMGFYSAVWPLIDQPLARFQIGLAGAWVTPDNSDNKDQPLAPVGTLARTWPERGPTWGSVFQTVEGGLGYWRGNRFRYGPPKFSMNATPQCYDYEVGSPGWSFFYDTEALPDDRLGIAQLSNRLLIPPDALPFEGNPDGKFLGYTYMALPFTAPTTGDPPTGDQAWTCFLSTANFKGPIAYYIPETWSKIGKLFDMPFLHGRGLDARPGQMGGGAMEINTVPSFVGRDSAGVRYSKIPELNFAVDENGQAVLVQDVTYYSKAALYDSFKAWRDGGPACSGEFSEAGSWQSTLTTSTPHFDQAGKTIVGVDKVFNTKVFDNNQWGVEWLGTDISPAGRFPQYFKHVGEERIAIAAADVPAETGLIQKQFALADRGAPFTSPAVGAWAKPGPVQGPFTVVLGDGSLVTYSWYRFVDQPSFQQYQWSTAKKQKLQALVEKIHRTWPIDRDYMNPPSSGELVKLDPALFVTPPKGLEIGYVPIVTRQQDATASH